MKLQDALSSISDGDAIFVYPNASSKLIDKLISWWEGPNTPFHTALVVWQVQDGKPALMVCQADPNGNNFVPISNFSVNKLHIVKKPANVHVNVPDVIANVGKISYSFFGAVVSGLQQYIPFLSLSRSRRKKFCSQYVADVYNQGGMTPKIPDVKDPFELEVFLLSKGCQKIEVEACV